MRKFLIAMIIVGLRGSALAAVGDGNPGFAWLDEYVGRTIVLRPSPNANPYVYLAIGQDTAMMEMRGGIFPLMVSEAIKINKVRLDVEEGVASMSFVSAHGEKGILRFIAPRASQEKMGQRHVEQLLALVTDGSPMAPFVVNAANSVLHFKGSNHESWITPGAEYFDAAVAVAEGNVLCPACFAPIHILPGYEDELELGRLTSAEIRDSHPIVTDDAVQSRVRTIGHKVLDHWPLPLRGYDYRFTVVEAPAPNATACPGGWIFVNEGLLSLCESDLELEAVLAHEISHVEMRHGLRQLRSAQKAASLRAIAGVVFSGIAASDKDSKAATFAAGMGALIVSAAADIVLAGYSRDMEMESDAAAVHYLTRTAGEEQRMHLARVLEKLDYFDQCETGYQAEWDLSWRHPVTSVRADFAANARAVYFPEPTPFRVQSKDGVELEIAISAVFQHVYHVPYENMPIDDRTAWEFGTDGAYVKSSWITDTRIFATVTAAQGTPHGAEFRDAEVEFDGVWLKFDDKEDTSLYPGRSTSVVISRHEDKSTPLAFLTPQDLRTSGYVKSDPNVVR